MKRILGMVVAIAGVLAFSSAASAALVVFDVSGSGTTWSRSTDAQRGDSGSADLRWRLHARHGLAAGSGRRR